MSFFHAGPAPRRFGPRPGGVRDGLALPPGMRVGLFGGSATLQLPLIPMRSISIGGSYVGSLAELRELVALAQKGVLPALPLSARKLSEVQNVLDELRAGKVTGRAILQH